MTDRDGDDDGATVAVGSSASDGPDGDEQPNHLRDVPDGAGCTEIWEHLSEQWGHSGENGHEDADEE